MSLSFARMQRSSSKALEPCNQTSQVHSRTRGACTCEVWLHGSSVFALERCIRLKAFSQIFATSAWTTPAVERWLRSDGVRGLRVPGLRDERRSSSLFTIGLYLTPSAPFKHGQSLRPLHDPTTGRRDR